MALESRLRRNLAPTDRPILDTPVETSPTPDDVRRVYGDQLTADEDAALEQRMRARARELAPPPPPAPPPPAPAQSRSQQMSQQPGASGQSQQDETFPIPEGQSGFAWLSGEQQEQVEQLEPWQQAIVYLKALTWDTIGMDQQLGYEPGSPQSGGIKSLSQGKDVDGLKAIFGQDLEPDLVGATVRGVRGAAVNAVPSTATLLATANNTAVEWYNQNLNAPFLDLIGQKGAADVARTWAAEARARQAGAEQEATALLETIDNFVPSAGESDGRAETLTQGISQFVTGWIATKGLAKAPIGGRITDTVVRGVVVNNVAFNWRDPTLGNLIEDFIPALKDSWITATSVDEDDSTAMSIWKRSIEGIGLDAALEGLLIGAAAWMRSAKKAEKAREAGPEAAADKVRKAADIAADAERQVAELGDASGPDISDAPPSRARMYQDPMRPDQRAARVESAARRAGVLDTSPMQLAPDEIDRAYGGGQSYQPDQILDMMDQVKAGERPRPLLTFVRALGGIRQSVDYAGAVSNIQAPRLLNGKSKYDLDAMAEKAAEAGYIPYDEFGRHDVNDLLDALGRDYAAEAAGETVKRVYSSTDAEAASRLPDLLRLERELGDLGIDPRMRGPNKRRQAAEEASRRAAGASYGGAPRSLDDLDALQRDMDAAGVTGFRPFDDDMLDADPVKDADGLIVPENMAREMSDEEMAAAVDALDDSDAFASAITYLDLEAKTGEEARAALLRNALELKRRAAGASPVSPEERAMILADDGGEGGAPAPEAAAASPADDVASRMAALRARMADPNAGAANNAMDEQPPRQALQPWQTDAGKKAVALHALRLGREKAVPFVDQMISFASDAEHRAALEEVRQIVLNTLEAKFADSAGDAYSRSRAALTPRRSLTQRENDLLEQIVGAAQRGVDPLRHIDALGMRPEVAREVLSHAVAEGRLGPWAAGRAAVGVRPGGMLDGVRQGRVPVEIDDATMLAAADALSPQEFEAWKLASLEGASNDRIAELLGGPDGRTSSGSVKVVLARAGRKGFKSPPANNRKGPSEKTQRVIDLAARGMSNTTIAKRMYPDADPSRADNIVAVLKNKWAAEVEARREEIFGSGAKFSENDALGDPRAEARMATVRRLETQGVDFFADPAFRQELGRVGIPRRSIGYANAWRAVMAAGGTIEDVLGVAQVSPRTLRTHLQQVAAKLEVAESSVRLPREDLLASDSGPGWDPDGTLAMASGRAHVQDLADDAVAQFGDEGRMLLESGAVVLHADASTVPMPVLRETTTAVFLRGVTHIIANRVPLQQFYGVMLHEVGVHAGMREMLGEEGFAAVLQAVRDRAGRPAAQLLDRSLKVDADDIAASEALSRVPEQTVDQYRDEELLAYFIQDAPRDSSLLRRITAGMAAWLYRKFPKIMTVMKPSQEALRQMAVRSLRRYGKQSADRPFALGGDNDHIGFYSAVERSIARMEGETLSGAAMMERIRQQPGVREAELQDMGLDALIGRRRSVTPQELRQLVADRRLYLERQISVVRNQKGEAAAGARDVRDVVYRLPGDTTGGRFSRTGSQPGRLSVARISARQAVDGREIMQIESLDSDVHPQNGYAYLRPEIIDPDTAARQEQLWAAMDGARRPIDELEREGVNVAGSLPEYRAWRTARQDLLNDIANNGDHVGFTAREMGVVLPPTGTPLRTWARATLRNLLAAASVTDADAVAIPVSRMMKKADQGQLTFIDRELPEALREVADEMGLELTTVRTKMGKLGEVEVPAIALSKLDKARLAQAGVPLYADNAASGAARGADEPANNLRVRAPGGRTIYVNLARIAADGDIRATIQRLADRYAGEVNAARGGARQSDEDLLGSVAAVDAWETLRNRRAGEPLGAKESLAARQLWAASAEWVTQIAERYRATRGLTEKFAFNQAMAVHRAIQAEVIGARTETARALRSWAIPVGSTADKLEQISGLLVTHGAANIDELAGRLARLGGDQIGVLDEVIEKSFRARTSDVLGEMWRASLLSNPKTHIVNMLSNTSVIALDLAETALAGSVSRLPRWLGGNPEAADMIAEAAAKYDGVMAAWRAQLKYFHENRRFNPLGEETRRPGPDAMGQTDASRPNAVSAEAFGLKAETMVGTTADAIGAVLNTPQALLGGADDFFKGINYQGELYGLAHRVASSEVRAGDLPREEMAARMAELVESPTLDMQAAARRAAQERTFTTPPKLGGVVAAVFKVREWLNASGLPIGHFILPFINTPANIMKWTFSRTPAGLLMGDMQRKLRAGGKDAMMAKVQIAMGTMGLSLGWQLAASQTITGGGPVDPGERQALQRTGWQPYSLKIGDTYIAYQRFDPIATYLSIAADMQEIQANLADGDSSVEQAGEVTALAIGAIGNAFLSKTYLQGVSDFNAFLADPNRYGERYLSNIAGSMFGPAGAAEIRRQVDPAMRDVTDILDSIKNRWPGASQDLPAARDLWGRPRMYQSHLGMAYDALSPFAARKIDPEPVDAEMIRLGYYPEMPNRSLTVPIAGRSVSVPLRNRPDIYNRMLELSGSRALDMANRLVQSPGYQNLLDGKEPGPGTKAFAIETIVQRNREVGRLLVTQEFWGDLQDMARKELARQTADQTEGAITQ